MVSKAKTKSNILNMNKKIKMNLGKNFLHLILCALRTNFPKNCPLASPCLFVHLFSCKNLRIFFIAFVWNLIVGCSTTVCWDM
jgi:hypothetical protein